MKTAIAIDSLLLRDDSIFLLELVLNLYPDSEIYTISHQQGGILGTVETKSIVSSFLTHKAKTLKDLQKSFWIMPSAVKGIPLHSSIENVIVLSRGFIHGLSLPAHVKRKLYIIEWDLIDEKKVGWKKVFSPYVNDWREKALRQYPQIAVSSLALQKRLELPNAEVIEPTYRTEEYPFVRDEDHNFMFTHQLVYTQDLSVEEFEILVKFLLSKNEMIRVLGPDSHLEDIKKKYPQVEFGGDHCEATNALYSHQAKGIWNFSKGYFPAKSFGAFATGRPVVTWDQEINREYLTQGAFFISSMSEANLQKAHHELEAAFMTVDRKVLRRFGLKWNERLFKSRMVKFLS